MDSQVIHEFEKHLEIFLDNEDIPEYAKDWVLDHLDDESVSIEEIMQYMEKEMSAAIESLEQEIEQNKQDKELLEQAMEREENDPEHSIYIRVQTEAEASMTQTYNDYFDQNEESILAVEAEEYSF